MLNILTSLGAVAIAYVILTFIGMINNNLLGNGTYDFFDEANAIQGLTIVFYSAVILIVGFIIGMGLYTLGQLSLAGF